MFIQGDIVKIQPDWLDKGEDPDTEYLVVDDDGKGHVKVICNWEGFTGYLTYCWPDYTMYKVGHLDDIDKFLEK